MNVLVARKLKYFLRLQYPAQVVMTGEGFRGSLPDLPGCIATASTLEGLYTELDRKRRIFLERCVMHGEPIPTPNFFLRAAEAAPEEQVAAASA